MHPALRKYSYYFHSIFELLFGFKRPLSIAMIFLNLAKPGVKTVRLRKRNLQFRVRGAMDVWSIKETFLDRFYEKFGFAVEPNWTVIDIGAGTGEFSIFASAALNGAAGRVFAYEPLPESLALLEKNLRFNGINNVQFFAEAIGPETGEIILDLAGGEPLQTQSRVEAEPLVEKGLRVKCLSLAQAFEEAEVESCDLLKMDCEGAEYSILFATPPAILDRIRHIVMEYHDNVTPYSHPDMVHFLEERGFQVEIFPNAVHSQLGYLRAWQAA